MGNFYCDHGPGYHAFFHGYENQQHPPPGLHQMAALFSYRGKYLDLSNCGSESRKTSTGATWEEGRLSQTSHAIVWRDTSAAFLFLSREIRDFMAEWQQHCYPAGASDQGSLPYDKELLKPQNRLLRYILEQPYSRDMACAILGLQKQHKLRCAALEERLVELILAAMERTEVEMGQTLDGQSSDEALPSTLSLWQHLSTQLIFFVLFQFASFPVIVTNLYIKISDVKLFKGRDFLMWILLQFISGSIQKNPLSDFLPVLRLYDVLYPEKEPLPVPDMTKPVATAQMSATCIWIHILKKAQGENQTLPRPLPSTLKNQYDYLQSMVQPSSSQIPLQVNDHCYRVALLCNAYSTNQEHFSRPMAALVEAIHGSTTGTPTANLSPTTPLSVQCLDSLTVHTKMSLIHNIVTHIMKVAQSKSNQNLAPALIETYARLLVYMEIESLGIKGFISQLLPAVYKSQAWGILHTLLEMFCYRLHHIQPHYRVQLLTHLHSLATNTHTSSAQLHLCVEMTSLRLITGFNSVDVQTQLSRVTGETKSLVSTESEELNRALVLTIARAIHVGVLALQKVSKHLPTPTVPHQFLKRVPPTADLLQPVRQNHTFTSTPTLYFPFPCNLARVNPN
ncbi:Mediator of RNA polymerase II transcription subunit 23 [Folsomia candida]|uniref:Mediator of RNA polymerase II transcription subunit 23 n=1 Tax=Folsomia candida TaxID=158441 RepID=A0A226DIT1_FOLCA|nr:Mediator of RNA polymerase II transcription subunit 23 [Folsomia candida]